MLEDTYRNKAMREDMVRTLKSMGVFFSDAVASALSRVPRHFFLDSVFQELAYEERALSIGEGQTISRPSTVARQSTLLEVFPGAKVLEVGTGSGYQAAILDAMGAKVYSIERQKNLFDKTKWLFSELNLGVKCFYGDGYKGLPGYAPFDRIIVTCGAAEFPTALPSQLAIGGIMIIPLGPGGKQVMHKLVRISDSQVEITTHGDFSFVPMLSKKSE